MGSFIFNGRVYSEGTKILSVKNRGLRYGDGLFETMKWKNDGIILADEHFSRLWKGMALLGFEPNPHFNPDKITEEISSLVKKNGHTTARVRLQVIRGDGGVFDPASNQPQYIIEAESLNESNTLNENGLVIGICDMVRKAVDQLSSLKHCNYLPGIVAAAQAKKAQWNDAVILNSYGRVCETSIANIFMVKDGQLITPSLDEGCVAGTFRKHLIIALKAEQIPVSETAIEIGDLLRAEEVFLTNAVRGIRWVKQAGSSVYKHSFIQKIFPLAATFS